MKPQKQNSQKVDYWNQDSINNRELIQLEINNNKLEINRLEWCKSNHQKNELKQAKSKYKDLKMTPDRFDSSRNELFKTLIKSKSPKFGSINIFVNKKW